MARKKASLHEVDDDEIESLVKETGGGSARKDSRDASGSGGGSLVWKLLVFLLIGVSFLLATDTVEVDRLKGKGKGKGAEFVASVKEKTKAVKDSVIAATSGAAAANYGPPGPRYTYARRGQPMDNATREALEAKWGAWSWDDEPERPNHDAFYELYPHRDAPFETFPKNAWQKDQKYMERYLAESLALVERTQEAILAEYGHSTEDEPGKSFDERADMFKIDMVQIPTENLAKGELGGGSKGGWSSESSWKGLKRRLQHALLTEDSFVFAMGGHSSSAGHGNHFSQSYTLQVAWIMESVFSRLGIKHESRNFGNGGLGTLHNGAGAGSIYGPDVSLIMWDSGMTERESHAIETFARQALLGGYKVPALWSFPANVLQKFHNEAGADVGAMGSSMSGIPPVTTPEEVEKIIWAGRYCTCSGEIYKSFCRPNEYNGTCWIDRDDYTPTTKQEEYPGGRASWHPGNRFHQLKGRTLAFTLLTALKEVLTEWKARDNYVVPDEEWHVGPHYANIRNKMAALLEKEPEPCEGLGRYNYFCKYPFQARTVFAPRAHSHLSSIATIMVPEMNMTAPDDIKSVYNPPDVFNPTIHPPPGEVDVLNIIEAGSDFRSVVEPSVEKYYEVEEKEAIKLTPGKGYMFRGKGGRCDGTLYSWCGKTAGDTCLLRGHNDDRGGYSMDSFSGWMILNLPRVKNGYVVIKLETWHEKNWNTITEGWTDINNGEGKARNLEAVDYDESPLPSADHRDLGKTPPPPFCDEMKFDVAINGEITKTYNKDDFLEIKENVQRVVEWFPILEDPNFTGGEEMDVQVAFRMTGCGRAKTFSFNHIYWS